MQFRPFAAQWFEVVVPRDDAHDTMETLARHAEVQFEWPGDPPGPAPLDSLREPVARYRWLAERYGQFWPSPGYPKRCCDLPLETEARIALNRIEHWLDAACPELDEHERLRDEQTQLARWKPLLARLDASEIDLGRLARAGPMLVGLYIELPRGAVLPAGEQVLALDVLQGDPQVLLALAARSEQTRIAGEVTALSGRCLEIPAYFEDGPRSCARAIAGQGARIRRRLQQLEESLHRLAADLGLDRSLGVLERIEWFIDAAQDIRCDDQVCWISGWTNTPDRSALEGALREVGVVAELAFRDPPTKVPSPSVTEYPPWLQPFEVFTRAVGVPGVREADPTTWVALLVPLLFGYMCGDVGHGVVIVVTALVLRARTKLWPLLAVCGVAAIVFGFVYGDVFGYEHLIDPLWVRPLDAPMLVLLVPLVAGTLVLTLGVALHLVGSCWRGEVGSRGISDLAQLLVYWGLLLMFLDPGFGWMALTGVLVCAANQVRIRRPFADLAAGLGNLAQSTFELLLNTLSFARVGAFALAHAALESTVVALSGSTRILGLAILIAVIGNLVVIILEGLVVTIQTTRLVLFEFFARFFEGEGRQFRPTAAPRTDILGRGPR